MRPWTRSRERGGSWIAAHTLLRPAKANLDAPTIRHVPPAAGGDPFVGSDELTTGEGKNVDLRRRQPAVADEGAHHRYGSRQPEAGIVGMHRAHCRTRSVQCLNQGPVEIGNARRDGLLIGMADDLDDIDPILSRELDELRDDRALELCLEQRLQLGASSFEKIAVRLVKIYDRGPIMRAPLL